MTIQENIRLAIATILNRRTDTCWADLAQYSLDLKDFDEVVPWGFWGNPVQGCRRDARLCGRCYCGKFQNAPTAEGNGWKHGDSRPIIVTSEITKDDDDTAQQVSL